MVQCFAGLSCPNGDKTPCFALIKNHIKTNQKTSYEKTRCHDESTVTAASHFLVTN